MNEPETRNILAQATALDNRKISEAAVRLWYRAFKNYSHAEVSWAFSHHVETSTEYLMPAHLIRLVNEKRSEYRMMNPSGHHDSDAWLEFERMEELAAQHCRELRASGAVYAVDAMDATTPKEIDQ